MKLGTTYSAFVLISALALTGCGADDDTAPSTSDAPASTSSTSASASSAQAKAGEYQPATEKGPAQNVPRPQKPEGMDVESVEGLEKFLNYWFEMRDYAVQTGDTNKIVKIVETYAETEQDFYAATNDIYKDDGWIFTAGKPKLSLDKTSVIAEGNGLYTIKAAYERPKIYIYDSNGNLTDTVDTTNANQNSYQFIARYEDNEWSLVNIERVGDAR